MTFAYQGRVAALALLAALITAGGQAEAQSASDKAAAEALFDQGVELLKAGKVDEACRKLERSQSVDPGIGTLLYLGECYKQAGRTASAWAIFREAASKADAVGETERARAGKKRANSLEPILSRIKFVMAVENQTIDGLTMLQGGSPVSRALWGSAVPVDPGELKIRVSAPGYETYETTTVVGKGPSETSVSIPALVALPQDAVQAASPNDEDTNNKIFAPVDSEPPKSGVSQRRAGLIVGGVGLLGLGVGGVFGALAIINENQSRDFCTDTTCSTEEALGQSNDAGTFADVSTVAFIAGGALLAGGAIIYYTAPKGHQRMGLQLTPTFGGAHLNMSGSF